MDITYSLPFKGRGRVGMGSLLRRFTNMDTTVKKDKKIIFVIALILGLVALYIVDMVILAWRL